MMVPIAIGDNVICELIEDSMKTSGGIHIPETAQKQLPQKNCTVISKGELVEADIRPGDTIVVHQQAGQTMFFDKKIYRVFKGPEIYGIVNRIPSKKQKPLPISNDLN